MNLDEFRVKIKTEPFLGNLFYPLIILKNFFLKRKEKTQEELFDKLCEILVEDLVINVEEFQGIFSISPYSDLFRRIMIFGEYEPKLVKACLDNLDNNYDVIDVGSNIGFYTVLFAKNTTKGKVLSIEPTKNALARLHKNICLNKISEQTIVFEGVATNYIGHADIKTVFGKEEYSTLGIMEHPSILKDQFNLQKVEASSIDELTNRYSLTPKFIKIDVEGLEELVLDGAKEVLNKYRPVILLELSSYLLKLNGSSSEKVISMLKSHNYDVFDPINPKLPPGQKVFGDILCLPK
jgi:FkbM family methyltransferase